LVWLATFAFDSLTELHLELFVPAFALGCVIKSDHLHGSAQYGSQQRNGVQDPAWQSFLDWGNQEWVHAPRGYASPSIQVGRTGIRAVFVHVGINHVFNRRGKMPTFGCLQA